MNHEVTVDPFDKNVLYGIGIGSETFLSTSNAVTKANFTDNTYEVLIDFGDLGFYVVDNAFTDDDTMHANSVDISSKDFSFICSLRNMDTILNYNYDTLELNWMLSFIDEYSDFTFLDENDNFRNQHDAQ